MSLLEKTGAATLSALVTALGVFLVATGGTFTYGAAPVVMRAVVPQAGNPGIESACKPILDANEKLYTTPYHLYMTEGAGSPNQKPIIGEAIFAGGAQFVLVNGKWSRSPMSMAEQKAMEQRNLKNTKRMSCHHVRDESVNGESAALYSAQSETARGKTDNQIWVSKSKGLLLRQESDMESGRANSKTHLSIRYEYSNVQAPKL